VQPAPGQPSPAADPASPETVPEAVLMPNMPVPDQTGDPAMPDEGTETEGMPVVPAGPYAPRSGSFRMLVYSRTTGYRHDSIAQGKLMLQEIAAEQGFEITETEVNDLITPEGLAQFEIVFFMNSTGDIFNQAEEAAFQQWMETKNGAFAGVHSATDTEQGWAFYKEVTGQYYDGHVNANTPGAIQFEPTVLQFPAVAGLPNPWQRNEEWYRFNSFQEWTSRPGLVVLGRKAADNQPIAWVREFGNWRSFYTGLGHDQAAFRDAAVKQHVTGGIMWAVRREQLLQ
jgi:type 1 glutamine amidotransferase